MKKKYMLNLSAGLIVGLSTLISSTCVTKIKIDDPKPPANPGDDVIVEPSLPVLPGQPSRDQNTPKLNIPGRPSIVTADSKGNLDLSKYNNLSAEEKNKADLEGYVNALKEVYGDGNNYINTLMSAENVAEYDKKAKLANQPDYESAILRNFSVVNSDGTLKLNPIRSSLKAAYWRSNPADNRGLPRFLPNQLYKDLALQSYAISFTNYNAIIKQSKAFKGTAWILDYQLDQNGYPTKWYLATNAHVVQGFTKSRETSNNDRFTNIVDVNTEAQEYNEAKAIFNQAENAFNELVKDIDKEIEQLLELEKEYHGKIQQAEANNNKENIARYTKLKQNVEEKLIQKNQERQNLIDTQWTPEWSLKWNKAKKDMNKFYGVTTSIRLEHFNENTGLNQWLKTNGLQPTVDTFSFNPSQVKLIYTGLDFLNTSPSQYVESDSRLNTLEEAADFAVLEIDFTSPSNNYSYYNNSNPDNVIVVESANELAELATANYANLDKNKQIKFASKTVKQNYEVLVNEKLKNVPLTNGAVIETSKSNFDFISLGFPISSTDKFIENSPEEIDNYINKNSQSIWINKPYYIGDGKQVSGAIYTKEYGGGLNKAISIRNWLDKPGVFDITITNPLINAKKNTGYVFGNIQDSESTYKTGEYINYGLGLSLNNWQPLGGASGSSVRNIDGELVAINYAVADGTGLTLTAFSQTFRSDGDDYNGFYGKYKLEKYDLIYGGGPNQRTSYRQALNKLNAGIRTNLFPNGTSDEHVPTEFRFS
ncbi:Ig-specific serine endopeptidase MIP [Mycoplasmopsis iners]|uniref:Ig-specific serine endopeptidase MIP n=1 Tax=Mycoplasmopsis iners TaxID=76630 RepID=UPI000497C950|nr:DUF31 family protein [Mycoplasmopsis iners]